MIFVTIGITKPFDRLLSAIEHLDDPEIVVQCGAGDIRPAGARCVTYLTYDELVEHVRRARLVVSHAGVGTILTALANAKRPLVMPRLKRFGEAADDHQVELACRLAELGLVTLVENPNELAAAVRDVDAVITERPPAASGGLATELRGYLETEIARATPRPSVQDPLSDRLAESGPR
jgi:UDP-N-acetylglucosamine transferase subunit ALG13